jgi:hypothetical protein
MHSAASALLLKALGVLVDVLVDVLKALDVLVDVLEMVCATTHAAAV